MVPATAFGILLALAQVFGNRFARSAVVGYLFIVRGIPLLVLLTFTYYLLPLTGIDLPPFWGVVLVMALYYAAFMSEVFRAGILSLPSGQWDAARSLGMTRRLMLRIVIFPAGAAACLASLRQPVREPGQGDVAGLHRRAVGTDHGEPRDRRAYAGAVPDLPRRGGDLLLHLLHIGTLWQIP